MTEFKRLRKLAGLTQRRTANLAGIARSRISELECGQIVPKAGEEARLRRVLRRMIARRAAKLTRITDYSD